MVSAQRPITIQRFSKNWSSPTGMANGGPITTSASLANSPVAAVRKLAALNEADRMEVR